MVSGPVFATTFSDHAPISLRSSPVRMGSPTLSMCDTMSMLSSIGSPSSLTRIGITRFPHQADHRIGVIVQYHYLLQMQLFKRCRHPNAETKRAMLEHEEL